MKATLGIDVLVVPWDSGRRGWRMGGGPLRLVEQGVPERLRDLGFDARVTTIEVPGAAGVTGQRDSAQRASADPRTAYALATELARAVRGARSEHRLPLVLAGNCNSALGTVTGIGARDTGVVWFDAHGDFNTPETSPSGFLDGMSLATLTGRCCTAETARIPDFEAVAEDAVVLVGARELDAGEAQLLQRSALRLVGAGSATAEEIAASLEGWPTSVRQAYLHIDLDVLDAAEARVNEYAAAGGLSLPDLLTCIDAVAAHAPIGAAALSALDPDADPDGRALAAAVAVIEQIAMRAAAERA